MKFHSDSDSDSDRDRKKGTMTTEIKHNADGSSSITVHRWEKTEIVTWKDGNLVRRKKVKLVSYDGIVWIMDEKKARTRFNRGVGLHPKFGQKSMERIHAEDNATKKEQPVFMPVTYHRPK